MTRVAVTAATLLLGPQPDAQRVDFMGQVLKDNGLQGCKQDGWTTGWHCKGKSDAHGVAFLPKNARQDPPEEIDYEPTGGNSHAHHHSHHRSAK
jgi:hypothetical protein